MKFAGIDKNDIADSTTGVTLSFWTQGCPFHCKNCHNPQTWDENGGYDLPENYIEKIIEMLDENNISRDLSILGGEPFYKGNKKIVYDLVKEVRRQRPETNIYIWSGYTLEELLGGKPNTTSEEEKFTLGILDFVDYLIDGLYVEELRDTNLKLRGSSNQHIYQNLNSRGTSNQHIYHPIDNLQLKNTILLSYKLIDNEEKFN